MSDLVEWHERIAPEARDRCVNRLLPFPLLAADREAVEETANAAVVRVVTEVEERFREDFDYTSFRRWMIERTFIEALRLLPEHRTIRPWLEELPPEQRRVLLFLYFYCRG